MSSPGEYFLKYRPPRRLRSPRQLPETIRSRSLPAEMRSEAASLLFLSPLPHRGALGLKPASSTVAGRCPTQTQPASVERRRFFGSPGFPSAGTADRKHRGRHIELAVPDSVGKGRGGRGYLGGSSGSLAQVRPCSGPGTRAALRALANGPGGSFRPWLPFPALALACAASRPLAGEADLGAGKETFRKARRRAGGFRAAGTGAGSCLGLGGETGRASQAGLQGARRVASKVAGCKARRERGCTVHGALHARLQGARRAAAAAART